MVTSTKSSKSEKSRWGRDIVVPALWVSVGEAEPADADEKPGDVRGGGRRGADFGGSGARADPPFAGIRVLRCKLRCGCGSRCSLRILRKRWRRAAGKRRRRRCGKARSETIARRVMREWLDRDRCRIETAAGRCRHGSRGEFIPGRRRSDRGRRVGGRIRDHRRIGAGDSRIGRRSLGGDRRHARAVR